jgi:hypothetical protein
MVEPKGTTSASVILTGRATTVLIHTSHERSPADNHGQHLSGRACTAHSRAPVSEPARSGFGGRRSFRPGYDRSAAWPSDRASLGEEPRPAMSNVIGRALANSACRSSGHNLGSQRAFLSRALWRRPPGEPPSGLGAIAYELDSLMSRVSTLPPSSLGPRPPHRPTAPTRCMRWCTVTVLPGWSGWRVLTRR